MPDTACGYPDFMGTVNCELCGANECEVVYPPRYHAAQAADVSHFFSVSSEEPLIHPLVRCQQCGLQYVNPRPRENLVVRAYREHVDENLVPQPAVRERTFARYLDMIEKVVPERGCILDVGTADGAFLHVCKQRGWLVAGCELNRQLCDRSQESYDISIHRGTIFDMGLKDKSFDVVTLWDVLEHTTHPKRVLQECHRVLTPGGWLVVTYPDINSLVARLMGRRWVLLLSPHLYYFTVPTMQKMLAKTGFRVLQNRWQWESLELGYILRLLKPHMPLVAKLGNWKASALHLQHLRIPCWTGQVLVMARRSDEAIPLQDEIRVDDRKKVAVLGAGFGSA